MNNKPKNIKNNNIDANFISSSNDSSLDDINSFGLVNDLSNTNNKKNKTKKLKESYNKEETKRKSSRLLYTLIVSLVVAVIVVAGVLIIPKISGTQFIINTIDPGTLVEQHVKFAGDIEIEKEDTLVLVSGTDTDPIKLSDTAEVIETVYTKLLNDNSFNNHEGHYYLSFKNMIVGYDNAISYIDEYNKTAKNKLKIPSKDDYKASNTDLVVVDVEMSFPNDFPSYNSEGTVFIVPKLTLDVNGTCDKLLVDEKNLEEPVDNYIVVDEIIYNIAPVIKLTDDIEEATITEKYSFKFLTSLPYNATPDLYNFVLTASFEDKDYNLVIDGADVKITGPEGFVKDNTEEVENTGTDITTEDTEK